MYSSRGRWLSRKHGRRAQLNANDMEQNSARHVVTFWKVIVLYLQQLIAFHMRLGLPEQIVACIVDLSLTRNPPILIVVVYE